MKKFQRGNVWVVFRTDRRLGRADLTTLIGKRDGFTHTISERLHCYGTQAFLDRDATVPDRVRVRLGKNGRVLDRRLDVRVMRASYANGAPLGCGADERTRVALFNLTETPSYEPRDYFLTANSGPYITDIGWHGWGSERAVGRGAFISPRSAARGSSRGTRAAGRALGRLEAQLDPPDALRPAG